MVYKQVQGVFSMKILLTGAEGQLGKELLQTFKHEGYTVFPCSKSQLDITNPNQIKKVLEKIEPDIIINTAAFTNVDLCEIQLEEAYLINGLGPYYLSSIAKEQNMKLIHISTDYVFKGDQFSPYEEDHITCPDTIYGKSKKLGEELALIFSENVTIIRTSWLYGHGGRNFVNTVKQLSDKLDEIKIVADQYGSPTYTKDLGNAIKQLINRPPGIYHITNSGNCSWFEFATEIITGVKRKTKVIPISTEEYGIKTPRPFYSVLSHKKIANNNIFMRNWKEGLYEYLVKEFKVRDDYRRS